jgi:predicted transcriptional regulator
MLFFKARLDRFHHITLNRSEDRYLPFLLRRFDQAAVLTARKSAEAGERKPCQN